MRWIVHIGVRKSGSKAIQRFLADESSRPDSRVYFPTHGRVGIWHEPLFFALQEENGQYLDAALADQPSQGQNIGVFSYEGLHNLPVAAIELLGKKLGEPKIVMFMRRQDQEINSLLNQFAKAHRVSFADVMEYRQTLSQYSFEFDYAEILSSWESVLGRDAITPIVYEKRFDSVRQFCNATGILFRQTHSEPNDPNPALSRRAFDAFLSAKAGISDPSELPELVNQLHRSFASEMVDTRSGEGPCLLSEGETRAIKQIYEASNEYVRRHWFPSRSKLFED